MQRRARRLAALALAALPALWLGCAGPRAGGPAPNWREQGLASWYGADFHGRRTANGERYNMYAMTAAHKTLPLGTPVIVTHRESGRRVRVRINDRGPFVAGRVIDLSYAAARELGSADTGVVAVTLEATLPGSAFAPAALPVTRRPGAAPPLQGVFAVQVGAFAVEANARALAARLPVPAGTVNVLRFEDNRGVLWRVRAGGHVDEVAADASAAALAEQGYPGFVVRED